MLVDVWEEVADAGARGANAVDPSPASGTEQDPVDDKVQGEQGAGLILAQGAVNLMWLDRDEFTNLLGPPEQVLAEAQRLRWLERARLPILQVPGLFPSYIFHLPFSTEHACPVDVILRLKINVLQLQRVNLKGRFRVGMCYQVQCAANDQTKPDVARSVRGL